MTTLTYSLLSLIELLSFALGIAAGSLLMFGIGYLLGNMTYNFFHKKD
jgi:predicted Kef-type K+ transport protein